MNVLCFKDECCVEDLSSSQRLEEKQTYLGYEQEVCLGK